MKLVYVLSSLSLVTACDDAPAVPAETATTASAPDTSEPVETVAPADTSAPEDTAVATETSATSEPDTVVADVDTTCADDCSPGFVCVDGACVCDPTPVSFAGDVQPLFNSGCGPGCHVFTNAASGSEGLNLHANFAHAELVDVPARQCDGAEARARVEPGDPDGSYLMDKLLGRDMCEGIRMPKGRSPFNAAKMAVVGRWICQGALDN